MIHSRLAVGSRRLSFLFPRLVVGAYALSGSLHAALGPPPEAGDVGRVRWSVLDEGEGWVPDGVALGDHGSTVFAGLGLQNHGLAMFAAGSREPVLETLPAVGSEALALKVATAASAPVAASITTHDLGSSGGTPDIVAVVRGYGLGGDPTPLFEAQLPSSAYNTTPGVAVSADGGVILAWWSVESQGGMLVTAYDASGTVLSRSVIDGGGILFPDEAALSHDGSTAYFSLPTLGEAVIYDVRAGKEKASLPDNGIFSGHAMSGDGRRFAAVWWEFLVGYHVGVFELDAGNAPVRVFERVYPDSVRVTQAALDREGRRLAYVVQEINPTDAFHVVMLDVDAGAELFEHTVEAPGTGLQLWCSGLALDDAGETLACASWGDELELTPEVIVLDARGAVLLSVDARGSGLYVAVSRDGALCFAACKATHAGVFGSGGDLYMIETRTQNLRLEGQPHVGGALDLSVEADPAFDRAVLFGGFGLSMGPAAGLLLDPRAGVRLLGVFPLANGELSTHLRVPASSALADVTAHLQAVLLDDRLGTRELTNKVSLHFLP